MSFEHFYLFIKLALQFKINLVQECFDYPEPCFSFNPEYPFRALMPIEKPPTKDVLALGLLLCTPTLHRSKHNSEYKCTNDPSRKLISASKTKNTLERFRRPFANGEKLCKSIRNISNQSK